MIFFTHLKSYLLSSVTSSLNITVNYFSTKYLKNSAGCVSLPEKMKVRVCPMDDLPCYVNGFTNLIDSDGDCEDFGEAGSASASQEESMESAAAHTSPADELLQSCQAYGGQELLELPFGAQVGLQSCPVNSSVRVLSSAMPSVSCLEDTLNDRNLFSFDEKSGVDLDQSADNQLSTLIKGQGSTSSNSAASQEIEIIELVTPPPDPRSKEWHGKRRRVPTVCQEIIDLTNSPVFIQL